MRVYLFGIAVTFLAIGPTPLLAQDAARLQSNMNGSDICSVLSFDSADIIDLFDPSELARLALQAVDTRVAWDKNFHEVRTFTMNEGTFSIEAKMGCQPSDQGAGVQVLEIFGGTANDLELKDNMSCNGRLDNLNCSISGELGRRLGAISNINEKMKALVQRSIE